MLNAHRLLLPIGLTLLTACAHKPASLTLQKQSQCPLRLHSGQQLVLILPSNPTTGFRWKIRDDAGNVLNKQGPEVYSNPEDAGLVGSAGQSTWLFQAAQAGKGRLHLTYERPWEIGVAPENSFDCALKVY